MAGYKAALAHAAEIAHEYGRKTYGVGGFKIRNVCHEIGKEIDPDVRY